MCIDESKLDDFYIFYIPTIKFRTKCVTPQKEYTFYITKEGGVTLYYNPHYVDIVYTLEEIDRNLTIWQRTLVEEMDKHGWISGELIVKEVKMQRETLKDFSYYTLTRE